MKNLDGEVFVVEEDAGERARLAEWIDTAGLRVRTFADTRELVAQWDGNRSRAIVLDVPHADPGDPRPHPSSEFRRASPSSDRSH